MSEARLPRGAVLLLAAMIMATPAVMALAEYQVDPEGKVYHRHTHSYKVFNDIQGDTSLQERASMARTEWHEDLTANGATAIRMDYTVAQGNAQIALKRGNPPPGVGDTGAAVYWQKRHHPDLATPTWVWFDASASQTWSANEKQGRVCNALGQVIGLEDVGPQRGDCMGAPQTYPNVGQTSINLVDKFYGPKMAAPDSTWGSLYTGRASLSSQGSYMLRAEASGHALSKIEFYLDGELQRSSMLSECRDTCSRAAVWRPDLNLVQAGTHTVKVLARNEFNPTGEAYTASRSFQITVSGSPPPPPPACNKWANASHTGPSSGTEAQPFKTAEDLIASLQPSEIGCFRAGTYGSIQSEFVLTRPEITLRPYGSESVTLKGAVKLMPSATGTTIEGLILDGRNTPSNNQGPTIFASDVTIRDNEITNYGTGICLVVDQYSDQFGYPLADPASGVVIERNLIHDCGGGTDAHKEHGIYLDTSLDAVISDNWIYDNAARGVQLYPNADGTMVTGNVIDNNGHGIGLGCGRANDMVAEITCPDRSIITGNVVSNSTIDWNIYDALGDELPLPSIDDGVVDSNCLKSSPGKPPRNGGIQASFGLYTEGTYNVEKEPEYEGAAVGNYRMPANECRAKYSGTLSKR